MVRMNAVGGHPLALAGKKNGWLARTRRTMALKELMMLRVRTNKTHSAEALYSEKEGGQGKKDGKHSVSETSEKDAEELTTDSSPGVVYKTLGSCSKLCLVAVCIVRLIVVLLESEAENSDLCFPQFLCDVTQFSVRRIRSENTFVIFHINAELAIILLRA